MDFFREQDIARRNTRLLVVLFVAAVGVLILLTNALVAGTLFYSEVTGGNTEAATASQLLDSVDWSLFLTIGAVIAATVGAVVLVNWLRFAKGGRTVAEALGGRPALPSTTDPLERRAQNIVQELALAANMPVPPLYILDDERGINAFAAGVTPANAVVAITRGAMVHLNRDELQGVIGHEFSHILNGDMRLSIRLAAMLRGITFIGDMGSLMLRGSLYSTPRRSGGKDDNRGGALVLGLGLFLIGLLGGVMAGMIKSAISKQKEYLADASSVQFTRNPDGIGDALKVIGGYTPGTLVHSARAEELSHLFFGQVKHRLWSLFATHPPLEKRIRKVDPDWDGRFIRRETRHEAFSPGIASEVGAMQARRAIAAAGVTAAAAAALAPVELDATPDSGASPEDWSAPPTATETLAAAVMERATEPMGAMALILALLWRRGRGEPRQQAALAEAGIRGLEHLVVQYGDELAALSAPLRLALIELCLPTLKLMSPEQYQTFKALLTRMIKADGEIDLHEWCLFQLVRHYLDPQFVDVRPSRPRYRTLDSVREPLACALGTLALAGDDDTEGAFARGADSLRMTLTLPADDALSVTAFSRAINQLADCYPLLKVDVLRAMAVVAGHDGRVSADELTLIKAIGAVLDCPLPNQLLEDRVAAKAAGR